MKRLRELWPLLDEGLIDDMKTSLGEFAGVEFLLDYNKLTAKRLFLVRFPQDINSEEFRNVHFRSLVIQMIEFDKYKELTFLILRDELDEIFLSFAEDLLYQTSSCQYPKDVLNKVSNIIFQWLKLFEKAIPSTLSAEMEKGLFGELYLFRHIALEGYNLSDLEEAWEGPLMGDKDFAFPNAKMEVKLSSSKHPTLKISSERQLDVVLGEREFIFFYQVTESLSAGEGLTDLIDHLTDILSSDLNVLERFNHKLISYGYNDEDRDLYRKRFSIRNDKVFQIKSGFPCISTEVLVPGVFNVSYEIELSACEPFRIDYLTVTELLNG